MAKLSAINNNQKKALLIQSKKARRKELKKVVSNKETNFEDRIAAVHKLAEMPRNSSPVRFRNRCLLTGRPRGFYRFFKLSRISIRECAANGLLPGVTKASW
jgi:small subunit ribosomal protein S14